LTRIVAILAIVVLTLGCSGAESPNSTTASREATTAAPDIAVNDVAAPADGKLADGRYFGRLLRVDVQGEVFHFVPLCAGETNPTLRSLSTEERIDTPLRTSPAAQLFIHRPVRQGDLSSGSFRLAGVEDIAQVVQNDPDSRWWLIVSRNAIQRIEQDPGSVPTASLEEPCPR
jgi:hypothetical protein